MAFSIDTARLRLDPQRVEDADEMAELLDDARLHRYTGGHPDTRDELRARYAQQVAGAPRGWLNWIVRRIDTGAIVGTVQATRFDAGYEAASSSRSRCVFAIGAPVAGSVVPRWPETTVSTNCLVPALP